MTRDNVQFSICFPVSICLCISINQSVGGRFASLDGLLVRLEIELDEEQQVTAQETATEDGRALSASAITHMRQIGPIVGDKVLVCCTTDEIPNA